MAKKEEKEKEEVKLNFLLQQTINGNFVWLATFIISEEEEEARERQ